MSEIQRTESEFTVDSFLIQQLGPEFLPFVSNLLLKTFSEVTKIIAKDNHRETLLTSLSYELW